MAILWALLVGLVIWITLWSLGIKAFDSFLILGLLVVGATAWTLFKPFLDKQLGRS